MKKILMFLVLVAIVPCSVLLTACSGEAKLRVGVYTCNEAGTVVARVAFGGHVIPDVPNDAVAANSRIEVMPSDTIRFEHLGSANSSYTNTGAAHSPYWTYELTQNTGDIAFNDNSRNVTLGSNFYVMSISGNLEGKTITLVLRFTQTTNNNYDVFADPDQGFEQTFTFTRV